MPSFIDVVTKNPALAESFKESTNKYLVPAILATLGTGAISYGIAGSKKRIGESDSARRRRIIRATLLPTLAAAVGSTALIGANTLLNTDANSFKLTRDILTDREKNNADINAPITKEDLANLNAKQNKKNWIDATQRAISNNIPGVKDAWKYSPDLVGAIGGSMAGNKFIGKPLSTKLLATGAGKLPYVGPVFKYVLAPTLSLGGTAVPGLTGFSLGGAFRRGVLE